MTPTGFLILVGALDGQGELHCPLYWWWDTDSYFCEQLDTALSNLQKNLDLSKLEVYH